VRVTKDAQVRRAELLDVALALSNEVGFDGMSVELVTQTAGVAKGTFYHYFKSKNDLLYALAERFGDGLFAAFGGAVESGTTPIERLRALMDAASAYKLASTDSVQFIVAFMRGDNQQLRHRLLRTWEATTRVFLRPVVAAGAADGSFRVPDVDSFTDFVVGLWFDFADRLWARALAAPDRDEFTRTLLTGAAAMCQAQERLLGVPEGTFALSPSQPVADGLATLYHHIQRKP